MLRNRFYYALKPWLPLRLRSLLRKHRARRIRHHARGEWPILEGAKRKPSGWRGWPEGKQFAFVLSHDIESAIGLQKVRQLAELEMRCGLRSSYNFVPEGEYETPTELREWLRSHRFEVGVHDLRHDGKLYTSRKEFASNAQTINRYLDSWDAVGFRSGFMLHRLEWLHDLNIQYDASTFDTDPFEPQPDGVSTIFPFWVPRSDSANEYSAASLKRSPRSGYAELPYTLVQDSTLFLHLEEESPDIWLKKLEWVASHGGMVLLNTHPDYMVFDGDPERSNAYSASLYQDFLEHVHREYRGAFWHALPQEVAAFVREGAIDRAVVQPRRIGVITHSRYESDNRVLRYAETLAQRGDLVEVMSLRSEEPELAVVSLGGVKVNHLQRRRSSKSAGQVSQLTSVLVFGFHAMVVLAWRHLWRRYDLVHVHNIPDFLVFSALLPRLTGTPVILDIHDLVPEFYAAKFSGHGSGLLVRLLRSAERASIAFANHVIISNHLWRDKLLARSVSAEKCSVFINSVDRRIFTSPRRTRNDRRFRIIFPGGLYWHQGLDLAVVAFARVARELPEADFHIYGNGPMREVILQQVKDHQLQERIILHEPVPLREVPGLMANADLGVVPKRADSFGDEAYSTKIMEFMSQRVPVILAKTSVDQYYFDGSVVRFFEAGSVHSLAEAMLDLARDEPQRCQLIERGFRYAQDHSWEHKQQFYTELVDGLITGNSDMRAVV